MRASRNFCCYSVCLLLLVILTLAHKLLVCRYDTDSHQKISAHFAQLQPPLNFSRKTSVAAHYYYELIDGVDVDGHDFGNIMTRDISILKKMCDSTPECKSFNTNGWMKTSDDHRVPGKTTLYVKMALRAIKSNAQDGDAAYSELEDMVFNLKIYTYALPPSLNVPHLHDYKYGVEAMFETVLKESAFSTSDPAEATLFFLPVRCAAHRYRVTSRAEGQRVAEAATLALYHHTRSQFPFWNASAGADHFYVCAHDMGASCAASTDAVFQKNAIAVVNTADYDDAFFSPHKDIALPPHPGDGCPTCTQGSHVPLTEGNRTRSLLAFFAGNLGHGRVRPRVLELWGYDPDMVLVDGALPAAAYHGYLQQARFCLVLRGHRGWSPRLVDAVWAGCVPVVVADHSQLPLQGLVDWAACAVLLPEARLPDLKTELLAITPDRVAAMQAHLRRVRGQLTWHRAPVPGDAFYSVLALLWRRRRALQLL